MGVRSSWARSAENWESREKACSSRFSMSLRACTKSRSSWGASAGSSRSCSRCAVMVRVESTMVRMGLSPRFAAHHPKTVQALLPSKSA